MRRMLVLAPLIAFGTLPAGRVEAASLEISPVIVSFAPGQTTAAIVVQNRGETPAAVQARAYSWAQAGDEDPLTATRDIILSPPIFTVAAGASQTMRLLLRGGSGAGEERSYRLLLDEVPPVDAQNKQIVMALRVSLPVIVTSASSALPTLQWRMERAPGGQTELTAVNIGKTYDRVSAIEVALADGSHPKAVAQAANTYVLPGAQRHWIVEGSGGAPPGPVRLSVTTQAGKSEQILAP
jgi:fimbrial chaperone protein